MWLGLGMRLAYLCCHCTFAIRLASFSPQISLSEGDEATVLERVNSDWWWVEVGGEFGYVPSSHLSEKNPMEDVEDQWQDAEYFMSYSALVQ